MKDRIKILSCACCGQAAPALKQWWNRDTGYGACSECFNRMKEKEGLEQAIENYGQPGIHHSYDTRRAAALISAAPELLELAKLALGKLNHDTTMDTTRASIRNRLRAAIAKAEGVES